MRKYLIPLLLLLAFGPGVAQAQAPGPNGCNAYSCVMAAPTISASVTISSGGSLSPAVQLNGNRLAGIIMPAAWTTANITFQTSIDGTNFTDLYDSFGNEYTVTVGGASRSILIPIVDFLGVPYIKVRSGTTGTPVNQGADRILTIVEVAR